jgi:hypothetical protein
VSDFVAFVSENKFGYRNLHNHNVSEGYSKLSKVSVEYKGAKVGKKKKPRKKTAPSVTDMVTRIIDEVKGNL